MSEMARRVQPSFPRYGHFMALHGAEPGEAGLAVWPAKFPFGFTDLAK